MLDQQALPTLNNTGQVKVGCRKNSLFHLKKIHSHNAVHVLFCSIELFLCLLQVMSIPFYVNANSGVKRHSSQSTAADMRNIHMQTLQSFQGKR